MIKVVHALNSIHPSVYGFCCVLIGSALCVGWDASTGKELIVGGFALITGAKMAEVKSADGGAQTK